MTQFSAPGGGTWRFNPPPGWPTPEAGWVPPPNWQPDPSWPPAPADWPFWVPVGYAPAGPGGAGPVASDPPSPKRNRLVLAAKVIAGVVTFAATVAATWITLADRPDPYTMTNWSQQANAACERNLGNVQLSLYTLTLQLAQVAAAPSLPGVINPQLSATVQAIGQLSAAYRTMNGDLRDLQVPDDANRTDIDGLLTLTSEIATTMSQVGTTLVNYQVGTSSADELQRSVAQLQTLITATIPTWRSTALRLDLNQCASSIPAAAPTATAPTLDSDQTALAGKLNAQVLTTCVAAPAAETTQIIAAINCQAVAAGPVRAPLVLQFVDAAAMGTWFKDVATGLSVGRCADGDAYGDWTHNDVTVGSLACKPSQQDTYLTVWTFTDDNIVMVAEAATREAIYTWWTNNAYALAPA